VKPIYFDHAATTPVHPEVVKSMQQAMETAIGNPSSVHSFGRQARRIMDESRAVVAQTIGAKEKEIIFTSGATEADNLAVIGAAFSNRASGNHIITTSIEHHATLHAMGHLEKHGFTVTYLPVNESGLVEVEDVENALSDDTILVSVMYVNNETGVIQPIREISEILKNHQALFHVDGVQALGYLPVNVQEMNIDLFAASGHKLNGPKGIGFLYCRDGVPLEARQFGGEQERRRRPGTENVHAVAGLQTTMQLLQEQRDDRVEKYKKFKSHFINVLEKNGIEFKINGDPAYTVSSIINISFTSCHVEQLLMQFDLSGIAASSGSACTAGAIDPSHVLTAMFGKDKDRANNSIRFSFGEANSEEDIINGAQIVADIIKKKQKGGA